jgi:hypothetical protein
MYRLKMHGFDTLFGYILENIAHQFTFPENDWDVNHDERTLLLKGTPLDESQMMASLLQAEKVRGTFKKLNNWRNELSPVYGPDGELIEWCRTVRGGPIWCVYLWRSITGLPTKTRRPQSMGRSPGESSEIFRQLLGL